MKQEHITRESLIDMFASFDNSCRAGILTSLERSIVATREDASESPAHENRTIVASLKNLLLMQSCCQQAQTEFEELSLKKG